MGEATSEVEYSVLSTRQVSRPLGHLSAMTFRSVEVNVLVFGGRGRQRKEAVGRLELAAPPTVARGNVARKTGELEHG